MLRIPRGQNYFTEGANLYLNPGGWEYDMDGYLANVKSPNDIWQDIDACDKMHAESLFADMFDLDNAKDVVGDPTMNYGRLGGALREAAVKHCQCGCKELAKLRFAVSLAGPVAGYAVVHKMTEDKPETAKKAARYGAATGGLLAWSALTYQILNAGAVTGVSVASYSSGVYTLGYSSISLFGIPFVAAVAIGYVAYKADEHLRK